MLDEVCIEEVQRVPSPLRLTSSSQRHRGRGLLLTRSGNPVLACEIKSSKNITPIALKGLRSFASEHPHVECIIVAPVDRSFLLENVEVLSVTDYFHRLKGLT